MFSNDLTLASCLSFLDDADFVFMAAVTAAFIAAAPDEFDNDCPSSLWQFVDVLSQQHVISSSMMDVIRRNQGNQRQQVVTRSAA